MALTAKFAAVGLATLGSRVAGFLRDALIATEGVTIDFTEDGIKAVARIAAEVNGEVENIGARRLQTVMEKLLEEVSFDAEDRAGGSLTIDAAYVDAQLAEVARNTDLSRFVL